MKKSFVVIALTLSILVFMSVSCKHDKKDKDYPEPVSWSPEPGEGGTVPYAILPSYLDSTVCQYFTVYQGEDPIIIEQGQFVSHPHVLIHSTIADDTVHIYNDRYIAFFGNGELIDFYGKQWDDSKQEYYNEAYRRLYVIGTGEDFTCYYLTEGYPNGMYAKQSTIFSGKWDESYGGLKDFQVAVILLETSGNPNLAPVNSFRVLGDGDGLAQDTAWIGSKRAAFEDMTVSHEDAFSMFRVR